MNQTEHRFDYQLTGSLGWWLCLTTKQTVIHSYVSALAPFSSGAVPSRPQKVKELAGQGFQPISSSDIAAITT